MLFGDYTDNGMLQNLKTSRTMKREYKAKPTEMSNNKEVKPDSPVALYSRPTVLLHTVTVMVTQRDSPGTEGASNQVDLCLKTQQSPKKETS